MNKKLRSWGCALLLQITIIYVAIGQTADIEILRCINSSESNFEDHTYSILSASASPLAIGVPVAHFAVGMVRKDIELKKKSYVMGISVASAMIISTGLKYAIHRTRPYVTYPDIHDKATDITPSFPSGHTTSAFSTATSLSLAWPKWYVIVPAYVWAGGVGYSRLYLGAHYPSDVLAGAILGTGSSYLTWKINQWLRRK